MANKKISQLTDAASLSGLDSIHVEQGGNSRKATLNQIRNTFDMGWGSYVDAVSAIEANAIAINAGVRTIFSVDGGTGTNTDHVNGSGIVWAGNEHRGTGIGDSFSIRAAFRAKKTGGAPAYLTIDQDISDGAGSFIVAAQTQVMPGDTNPQPFSFNFLVFTLDTYTSNGARFYLTPSQNIQIWAKSIFIRKDFNKA